MSNELSHYGVPGMRRGVRKAEPVGVGRRPGAGPLPMRVDKRAIRRASGVAKGNNMIEKYGSRNKAYAVIAGRRIGVAMLSSSMANVGIAHMKDNPALGVGLAAAGSVLNVGMFVKDVTDAARVHAASKAQQAAQGAKR